MPEAPRAALVCRAGRPFACRLSLPLWCPMGWRARQVAGSAGVGGAQRVVCLLCRLPTLPLVCFLSPIPPPALAERSSPPGKGEIKVIIFMQGASPLASPRPSRKRHGLNLRCRCPKGGLPSLSPANLAFGFISFPHPPAPLPGGKGGRLRLFSCKGLRPLHPRGLSLWFAV